MSSYWIAGKHTVLRALENEKNKIHKILLLNTENSINIDKKFHKLIFKTNKIEINNILKNYKDLNHQGHLALIERNNIADLKNLYEQKNILILDGVNDQRNIGAIIRTACAFNIKYIIVNKKDILLNNLLLNKTASGGVDLINIIQVSNILNLFKKLKEKNYWIYGFDGKANEVFDKHKLNKKNVLVFGSESNGMKNLTKKKCDFIVRININTKIESLNVSTSVASALTTLNAV